MSERRVRQLRLVVETEDYEQAVAPPTETPRRSLNARLDAPAGLHITVFQELDPPG